MCRIESLLSDWENLNFDNYIRLILSLNFFSWEARSLNLIPSTRIQKYQLSRLKLSNCCRKKRPIFYIFVRKKRVLRMAKEWKIESPWLSEVLDLRTLSKKSLAHGSLIPDNRLRIQSVRHSLSMPGYNAFCVSLN